MFFFVCFLLYGRYFLLFRLIILSFLYIFVTFVFFVLIFGAKSLKMALCVKRDMITCLFLGHSVPVPELPKFYFISFVCNSSIVLFSICLTIISIFDCVKFTFITCILSFCNISITLFNIILSCVIP